MPVNVEIKARVEDMERLHLTARSLSGTPPQVLEQEDTFFNVPRGRLKLRILSPATGQLIYYEREDTAGPKTSQYSIAPVADIFPLKSVLSDAFGVRAVVRKRRTLYTVGQTRIHLDEVDGLGCFVELEVVLKPGQTTDEGVRIMDCLMVELGIRRENMVAGAYVDLVEAGRTGESPNK